MSVLFAIEQTNYSPRLFDLGTALVLLFLGWLLRGLADRKSQAVVFDHRLRLEKEYALYSDLWQKLFELRRAVGQKVSATGDTASVRHEDNLLDLFNEYQAAVRKGDPFMAKAVNEPSRAIAKQVRSVVANIGARQNLEKERQSLEVGTESDMKLADKMVRIDEDDDMTFKEIEKNFQMVLEAIRARITP